MASISPNSLYVRRYLPLIISIALATCWHLGCGAGVTSPESWGGDEPGVTVESQGTDQDGSDSGDGTDSGTKTDDRSGGDEPDLQLSSASLDFGSEETTLTLLVRNAGGGEMAYDIYTDEGWLYIDNPTGTALGEGDTIVIHVDRAGLDAGTYLGVLTIDAGSEIASVNVRMLVGGSAGVDTPLTVNTTWLDFGTDTYRLTLTITNTEPGIVTFGLVPSVDWIELDVDYGDLASQQHATIYVTVRRCSFDWQDGLNSGEIQVGDSLGGVLPVTVTATKPALPSRETIVSWLESLPALPKVHYSWPLSPWQMGFPNSDLAYQWVRITRGVGLSAEWTTQYHLSNTVALCQRVNDEIPGTNATIALHWSPYHHTFPAQGTPFQYGPEVDAELDLCRERLTLMKDWVAQANAEYGANVQIASLLLDCEPLVWATHEHGELDAEDWNAALTAKYDDIYLVCKDVFPDVPVDWFLRGTPCCVRRFTTEELGDSYTAWSYWTHDLERVREDYRGVYEQAQADGVDRLLMWPSLACGWIEPPPTEDRWQFVCDMDYDLENSWQLGAELNDPWYSQFPETYAQWDAVDIVVLYLPPLDPRTPNFFKHFAAYVRGAHGLPLH